MSAPIVVDEGTDVALTVADIGGVVTPAPSIATGGGRVAAAWTKQGPSGPEVAVFDSPGGGLWHPLGSPSPELPELLPTLTYDEGGRLWLLVARPGDGQVDYKLYGRNDTWGPGVSVGGGPSAGFSEIGEGFGLVGIGPQVVAAVPVDGPTASSLSIARVSTPAPATTDPLPSPSARRLPASGAGRPLWSRDLLAVALAAAALSVAGAPVVARVRRRR